MVVGGNSTHANDTARWQAQSKARTSCQLAVTSLHAESHVMLFISGGAVL
jgi:hypothetical protein